MDTEDPSVRVRIEARLPTAGGGEVRRPRSDEWVSRRDLNNHVAHAVYSVLRQMEPLWGDVRVTTVSGNPQAMRGTLVLALLPEVQPLETAMTLLVHVDCPSDEADALCENGGCA